MDADSADGTAKAVLRRLLDTAWERKACSELAATPCTCCINTELDSTSFLISREGGRDWLIDWEKPL